MKVIKFSAAWCGPCKVYHTEFEKTKEKFKDNKFVEFVEYDMDEDSEQFDKYEIRSIPYTILEKDGNVVMTHSGTLRSSTLEAEILTHL